MLKSVLFWKRQAEFGPEAGFGIQPNLTLMPLSDLLGYGQTHTTPFVPPPLVKSLKEMSKNQRVGGRDIRVLSVEAGAARVCHLVFVASNDPTDLDDVLQQKGKPILTVAESDGFAERGGIIQIRFERNPVRGESTLGHRTPIPCQR